MSARSARRPCTTRRRWPPTTPACSASSRRRRARNPTTWPGRRRRLQELDDRTSLLNPLWYAGAFGIGLLAGRLGPGISLGFVAETERQVEQHLQGHLDRLPAADHASRAIVQRMMEDEARHAADARAAGAVELPAPVKLAMRLAAKVMTRTAHHV